MNRGIVAAIFALASVVLAATSSQAVWSGPGYNQNSVASQTGKVDGTFGFNTSFGGAANGRANTGNQFNGQPGYADFYRPRPLWIIRGVNFKYDSAELTSDSLRSLDSVAVTLREHPGPVLEVGGHASDEGTVQYNLDLSQRRAQSVHHYLVKQGVKSEGLTYRGYGESRPLVANFSESGRRLNRRVELAPVFAAR